MMHTKCIFCGADVLLVHVHGHYQCPVCKTNALPCCDADSCNNYLITGGQDMNTGEPGPPTREVINTGTKSSAG